MLDINNNMSSVAICITVDEKTLKEIDKIRGMVPRSAFIQNILNKNLIKKGSTK